MTPTRIIRFIGVAGLIGWFGMVGWVAKTTQAQNGGALPPPAAPAAGDPKDAPPAILDPGLPRPFSKVKAPAPPVQVSEKHQEIPSVPGLAKIIEAAPPVIGQGEPPPPAAPTDAAKDSLPPITPERYAAGAPTDDPEKSAQAFVERSRKEAEAHLKALTTEAAQLRSQLAKLESGIKRWQTLVNALRGTQARGSSEDSSPSDLEPLPQAATGDPRADRRVKWASSNPPAPAEDTLDSPGPSAAARELAPAPYARPATAVAPGLVPR